jgi:outer membrane protein, heavy metal efflux system
MNLYRSLRLIAATALALCGSERATAQPSTLPAPAALSLRDVLDSVRATLPAIRAANSRVRAAAGARTTAGLPGNPVLSYQVDQTPFPGRASLPPDIAREGMTTATFPIEFLYQRGPRVTRADAEVRAADADAATMRQRAGLDAAMAFYATALSQTRVATTRDLVGWLDSLVSYNRARVGEGATAEADLIRTVLERDRMRAELTMREAELARSRATLAAFVFEDPTAHTLALHVPSTPLPIPPLRPIVRPEVRAARERFTASSASLSSERTMIVRQLGATIGTMQTMGTTSMIAGLSLPFPLFDQNRGELQRARAERDATHFEVVAQERAANAELTGATDAATLLYARMVDMARSDSTGFLARADESRQIALATYREGAAPLYQVIDAARAWMDARNTYYDALFAQHQSVLALVVANGTDLFTMVAETPALGERSR